MAHVGKTRIIISTVTAALLVGGLTACDDGRKGAEAASQQLASALAALDAGKAPFDAGGTSDVPAALKEITAGMGSSRPVVTVSSVNLDGQKATASLTFDWPLSGSHWKYSTQAHLGKDGDSWKTQWQPDLLAPGLQQGETLTVSTTAPPRADITGAGNAVLVTNRPVLELGLDKSRLGGKDPVAVAGQLAKLADVDAGEFAARVKTAGAQAFVSAITYRADSPEAKALTPDKLASIPGARTVDSTLALAPDRTFARAVLGTVGEVTAEQVEKSKGELKAGDMAGLGGLQSRYDRQLRGTSGVEVHAVKAQSGSSSQEADTQKDSRVLFEEKPTPGQPLKTTLDVRLQQLADSTLSKVTNTASALVAIRPSDGAVLAAASGPGSNGYNTAMLGQYAPGSTFKIVDSLALVRDGKSPSSTVSCTPSVTVDGRVFKNAPGYPESAMGQVPLETAFAHSCNTAFINARDTVTQAQQESAARGLGVGLPESDLGFDAFLGSVPETASGTEHAASMIGQGKILLSPLAGAVMAASVAKGAPVTPHLVAGETGAASSSPSAPVIDKPITAAEAAPLRQLMRAVVTSGHAGFLSSVSGAPVGAKTGTAEYGTENPPKTHAWIVATHGDLAVAVFVDDGGFGAETSGPLLKAFLDGAAD
ncbi:MULTISPECIES: penicillin-binding transpeptidase domain-containing protein [Arthrobacter]|uniref:Beta-lactamase n=2 Tax=Arthrobacter TaxID=1663 RepID=A0ABU9KGF9_9MICC|nr:penicillin-binding transpeptidase domain-containing protein [Arthrobacter sp. YJM1]MDP5225985.1 penicillin-binding transpeptidase domain-containing protein [Arthrobacter sp. YJM1]